MKKKLPSRKSCLPIGFQLERQFQRTGFVLGMDEVGRGCIAGPVCTAAVAFPPEFFDEAPDWMPEVVDSKLVSEKKRKELCEKILSTASFCEIEFVSAKEVDRLNILQATMKGFASLVVRAQSEIEIDAVLVDGHQNVPGLTVFQKAIIGGDRISRSVAAASIVAKHTRDEWMRERDVEYPQYHWAKNKGYGTAKHWEALESFGPCEWHRKSFLSRLDRKLKGRSAEKAAAEYLKSLGFEILEQNWRSTEAEIDIIARKEKRIHIVEVRSRSDGDVEKAFPFEKRQQVKKAAQLYLRQAKDSFHEFQFDFLFFQEGACTAFWNESL